MPELLTSADSLCRGGDEARRTGTEEPKEDVEDHEDSADDGCQGRANVEEVAEAGVADS